MDEVTAKMGAAVLSDSKSSGSAPVKDLPHSNLYVAGLDPSTTEGQLRARFEPYGRVKTVRLVRNARDGKTFAFVKLATIQEALAAIAALHKTQVGGTQLEVKSADADAGERNPELLPPPSDNLYAKNLPKDLTQDELSALFSPYGSVIECRVLHSGTARSDSGTGAGALVRMSSVEEAAQAIAHLHNQRLAGSVLPLVVRYADTQEQKAKKAARQAKRESSSQARGYMHQQAQAAAYMHPVGQHAMHEVGSYHSHSSYMGSPGYYSPVHTPVPSMVYGPQTCSVYVKHLPEEADRLWLYEKFAPFGGVLSVRVLTTEAGVCRGVGFINYADPDSAGRAVATMNGMPVGPDKRLFVALQQHRQGQGQQPQQHPHQQQHPHHHYPQQHHPHHHHQQAVY